MLCCSVPSFLALRQVDCGRETAWLEDETLYFLSSPSFSLEALISSQSSGPSASMCWEQVGIHPRPKSTFASIDRNPGFWHSCFYLAA